MSKNDKNGGLATAEKSRLEKELEKLIEQIEGDARKQAGLKLKRGHLEDLVENHDDVIEEYRAAYKDFKKKRKFYKRQWKKIRWIHRRFDEDKRKAVRKILTDSKQLVRNLRNSRNGSLKKTLPRDDYVVLAKKWRLAKKEERYSYFRNITKNLGDRFAELGKLGKEFCEADKDRLQGLGSWRFRQFRWIILRILSGKLMPKPSELAKKLEDASSALRTATDDVSRAEAVVSENKVEYERREKVYADAQEKQQDRVAEQIKAQVDSDTNGGA